MISLKFIRRSMTNTKYRNICQIKFVLIIHATPSLRIMTHTHFMYTLLKKIIGFPVPCRDVTHTKLFLAGYFKIIPGQEESGKWHPGWGQENRKLFFTVYSLEGSFYPAPFLNTQQVKNPLPQPPPPPPGGNPGLAVANVKVGGGRGFHKSPPPPVYFPSTLNQWSPVGYGGMEELPAPGNHFRKSQSQHLISFFRQCFFTKNYS